MSEPLESDRTSFPTWRFLSKEERRALKAQRAVYFRKNLRLKVPDAARNPRLAKQAKQMLTGAKARAQAQKVPFSLTATWVLERLHAGKCELTGLDLDLLPVLAPRGAQHRSNFVLLID